MKRYRLGSAHGLYLIIRVLNQPIGCESMAIIPRRF